MLFTEQTVLTAVQEQGGIRTLFLNDGDRLTPSARDLLRRENITLSQKKAEHMTHLNKESLVTKGHPIIAFRGKLDTLQAEILLLQKDVPMQALDDMLALVRRLMQAEVLNRPLEQYTIGGMDEKELHERSHQPQKYYGIGHFLPSKEDDVVLLRLNRLRTVIRETELACYHAFAQKNGKLSRTDILTALNRLSSACWVLCLARKGEAHGTCH